MSSCFSFAALRLLVFCSSRTKGNIAAWRRRGRRGALPYMSSRLSHTFRNLLPLLRKWDYFPAVLLLAVALRASSALGTHLCTGILVSPGHQVIQGHVLVHRHVAELERKDLASGRRVGKRHIDDPIEATRTHQSLEGEEEKTDLIISPLPSNFFGGGGVTDILSAHHESAL